MVQSLNNLLETHSALPLVVTPRCNAKKKQLRQSQYFKISTKKLATVVESIVNLLQKRIQFNITYWKQIYLNYFIFWLHNQRLRGQHYVIQYGRRYLIVLLGVSQIKKKIFLMSSSKKFFFNMRANEKYIHCCLHF